MGSKDATEANNEIPNRGIIGYVYDLTSMAQWIVQSRDANQPIPFVTGSEALSNGSGARDRGDISERGLFVVRVFSFILYKTIPDSHLWQKYFCQF